MPTLTIKTRGGRTTRQKQTLMRCIKEAALEAFHKEDNGLYIWLEEYNTENSLLPKEEEDCIIVQSFSFGGRSQTDKDRFYRLAADKLSAAGEPADNLIIVLADPPLGNWGIAGKNASAFFAGEQPQPQETEVLL